MEKMLEVGQIVWAKVRGYPWWPGIVAKIYENHLTNHEDCALVNFIGDPTHAKIQFTKIEKFEEKKKEFSKTKKRSLINAIGLAENMIKGDHTNMNCGTISGTSTNNIEKKECNGKHKVNKKKDAISLLNHKRKREKVVLRKRESNKESVSSAYKTSGIRDYVVNKLNALLEYRFTQPLLFSKKKFISNLDLLIQDIPFTSSSLIPVEVIKKVLRFLQKMISNRNSLISTKCFKLKEMIKNKLIDELFNFNSLALDQVEYKETDKDELSSYLSEYTKSNDSNFSNDFSSLDKKEFALFKRKNKDQIILKHKQTQFHKEQNNIESCSVSALSINSSHTDCEETKQKNKVKLTPLDKKEIFSVLIEYFSDDKLDEDNFIDNLKCGKLFNNCMSSPQIIKHLYLRRRVCYKLFSVFDILLKHLSLEIETIKSLAKYLEMKARNQDPNMEEDYRRYISNIFNKIKNLLPYGESLDEDRIAST